MAGKARVIIKAGKLIKKALKKKPRVKVKKKPITRKEIAEMELRHSNEKAQAKKISKELQDMAIKDPTKRKFLGRKDRLEVDKRLEKMTQEGVKAGKVKRIEDKQKPLLRPGDIIPGKKKKDK